MFIVIKMKKITFFLATLSLWVPSLVPAQNIFTTVHNLSTTGPGSVKANTEDQLCIFCHAPHNATSKTPLWNKSDPAGPYIPYSSTTLDALPGQPDGSSIMCLSCHDGTIALGNINSRPVDIDFLPVTTMPLAPASYANLSTDLRDDHPISFVYSNAVAIADGQLLLPGAIVPPVALEATKVQCISCHDVHQNLTSDFLVATQEFSTICNSCHTRTFWAGSTHNSSGATWNATPPDPWPTSPYTTVGQNDCSNCHWAHNAGGVPRLLKYQPEEDNCLDCHNANVASTDIAAEFAKPFKHNVVGYLGTHDPTEPTLPGTMHVECVDCHNPHASNASVAVAPNANGFQAGVKGINQAGGAVDPIAFEYELCYRCHADNPATPVPRPRLYGSNNVRLDFATTNFSYHPVVGGLNNPEVNSLILPLTNGSIIYCTDCHASNGEASAGPHGSIYPQILVEYYNRGDNLGIQNSVSAINANFPLCTRCHDANLLRDKHLGAKNAHFFKKTSCNNCHDPHGFPGGNMLNNNFLINFNTDIISPNGSGDMFINMYGGNTGDCNFLCHGKDHDGSQDYAP